MSDQSGVTPPAPAPAGGPSSNAKLMALLGWLIAPIGVIFIFMDDYKNDPFVRSHVIQAAGVWVVEFIAYWIFGLGIIVAIYRIYMAIAKAYKGEMVEVPVIYGLVKNMIDNV